MRLNNEPTLSDSKPTLTKLNVIVLLLRAALCKKDLSVPCSRRGQRRHVQPDTPVADEAAGRVEHGLAAHLQVLDAAIVAHAPAGEVEAWLAPGQPQTACHSEQIRMHKTPIVLITRGRRATDAANPFSRKTMEPTMTHMIKIAIAFSTLLASAHALAQQITLYQDNGWRGRAFTTSTQIHDLRRIGFNDRASSVVVGSGRWEVCEDVNFQGNCRILRPGSYDSLGGMGMNDRITSLRHLPRRRHYNNEAPAPLPQATYEYRQRPNEWLDEAPVLSAHAVVGPPEQRCWIEREQVPELARQNNAAAAIAGAIIGGVLGHQIGGGTGRDIATASGAIAGAAVGSNVGGSQGSYARDVQRCETVVSTTPEYWDVVYVYRGVEHRVQLASAPGSTITVNRDGLPRL